MINEIQKKQVECGAYCKEEQFAASWHDSPRSAEPCSQWALVGIDLAVELHCAQAATVPTCSE